MKRLFVLALGIFAAFCAEGAVAQGPGAPAVSGAAQGPLLLVSAKQSRTLSLVDPVTLQVVARVPVAAEDPHEVVIGPDDRTAYISHLGDGHMHTLTRVDLVSRRAMPPLDVAPLEGVHGMAVHGAEMWVTAVGSKALARIDPQTGRVLKVLGTGQDNTHMLWISRDGRMMLAANAGSGTMTLFTLTEPGVNTGAPVAAGAAPDWKAVLLPVGAKAEGFTVSPEESEAWVGNDDGTVTVLDLRASRVEATFAAGIAGANRLRFTPDGREVIATTHRGTDLVVIDHATRAVTHRIAIEEHGASGIAIAPDGRRAYIACPRDHFVAVVDLEKNERVATISAGIEPDGIVWWDGGAAEAK